MGEVKPGICAEGHHSRFRKRDGNVECEEIIVCLFQQGSIGGFITFQNAAGHVDIIAQTVFYHILALLTIPYFTFFTKRTIQIHHSSAAQDDTVNLVNVFVGKGFFRHFSDILLDDDVPDAVGKWHPGLSCHIAADGQGALFDVERPAFTAGGRTDHRKEVGNDVFIVFVSKHILDFDLIAVFTCFCHFIEIQGFLCVFLDHAIVIRPCYFCTALDGVVLSIDGGSMVAVER